MDPSEEKKEDNSLYNTSMPTADYEAWREEAIIQAFGSKRRYLALLPPGPKERLDGATIIHRKISEHLERGWVAMETQQFETAVRSFSKALYLLPLQLSGPGLVGSGTGSRAGPGATGGSPGDESTVSRARLLAHRGEAYLHLCDFSSASDSYERAEFLEQGTCQDRLAFVYYKQGECLFDGGQFLEALEVFKRAAALRPGNTAFKAQSLNCLLSAGRYDDSLETLDDLIAESPTADLYLARARLHHLMNQPVLCHQDLDSARALEPAHPEAAALLRQLRVDAQDKRGMAVEAALRGELRLAVTALNVAVDWDPQDGRLYLFRGTLLRRLRDFPAALEDLDRAAQLLNQDPGPAGAGSDLEELHQQTALTYNDMAVLSFTEERYTEAMQLLNRALDQDRNQPSVYLHRGDCFFRLGDWRFALADYQQAEEIVGSGDPAVRNRLAVIHNMLGNFSFEDGCFQEAVDMFSQALRYNPSASRYYENRLKARRKIQDVNGAREDLICLLVLDPSGDEVPAYLMSLFPRTKKSSIFSSPRGQAVQARLSEAIQTWIQSEDRRRLTERIQVTEAMSRLELADRQGHEQE